MSDQTDHSIPLSWPDHGLKPHRFAGIFRMLSGDEKEAFGDDIAERGLKEKVKIFHGAILDGRNRYLALVDNGVFEPEDEDWQDRPELFEVFTGTEAEALDYVWSLNEQRRHDTPSQRAAAAARYANLRDVTQAEAAARFGVSERQINSAAKVLERGTPELQAALDAGRLPAYLAEQVADLGEDDQREVAAQPKREASAVAKRKLAPLPTLGEVMGLPPSEAAVAPGKGTPTPAQRIADKYIGSEPRDDRQAHRVMLPQGRPYVSFLHHVIEATRGADAVSSEWLRELAEEYRLISTTFEGKKIDGDGFLWAPAVIQHVHDVGNILPLPTVVPVEAGEGTTVAATLSPTELRSAYEAALSASVTPKGSYTRSTAEPIMRAGVDAEIKRQQMAEDLGHPLGTVQGWTAKLKLTDPARLRETAAKVQAHNRAARGAGK